MENSEAIKYTVYLLVIYQNKLVYDLKKGKYIDDNY